jgi:hypothetical protein
MGARFLKSSSRRSQNADASYDRDFQYRGYEDRYGASFAARRTDPMQHAATPTPMAPPRRDPTLNTTTTTAPASTNPLGGTRGQGGSTGSS